MSDQNPTVDPSQDSTPANTPPAPVPDMGDKGYPEATPVADMTPEQRAAYYKAQARKHEAGYKNVLKQLEELKAAQMTEAERAIAEAKAQARSEALREVATDIASNRFEAAAARAGVDTAPIADLIDARRFVNEDGTVNDEAITATVARLAQTYGKPKFDQDVLGNAGSRDKPTQLTEADLRNMTPEEINKARREGRLNDLLGIS